MVVPFGLSNEPTTFMCLINNMLKQYLDKFVSVFVDGILVYSKTKEAREALEGSITATEGIQVICEAQ